jgi:hypothetical protein
MRFEKSPDNNLMAADGGYKKTPPSGEVIND